MEPKPFQKPYPPLWFGAASEPAVRRAVRMGYGFFGAGSTTTARFAELVPVVHKALADAGRPAEDFPIAKRVYIGVDDDGDRARERMNAALERHRTDAGYLPSRPPRWWAPPPTASASCARWPRRARS